MKRFVHQERGRPEVAPPRIMDLDSTLNQGRPWPMDSPDPAALPRLLTCSPSPVEPRVIVPSHLCPFFPGVILEKCLERWKTSRDPSRSVLIGF